MAATDNSKKSFWKRGGGNTKLPGRAQQVYKTHEPSPETIPHPQLFNSPVGLRPRSKTFEEYEKETNDAWDDREEDLSDLSLPAELDFPKSDSDGSGRDGDRKRVNSKGKSDLRSFFTEVVKPRTAGSPLGRRRGHGGRHRTSSAPDKSPSPPPYHSRPFQDDIFDPPDRETMKLQKFGKLLAGPNTSLDELRKLSWSGIPPPVRATTWQLLCGYLPANIDRREEILQRKRQEYRNFILQYYPMRDDPLHIDTFRQIHIDVPRMNPNVPLFQQQIVQECFERILFIWSMRHPASGYVQGINDLVTPFFVVYLSYYISGDKNPETYDISQLAKATLGMIEADCFWCLQHLLEGIQDNYTLAQPGVQTKIMALKDLITRLDGSLGAHLKKNSVEFIQFAFRWMNNLLMREFPLRCVIRLWDSYLSENDGFATFHVYVCTALLARFSEEIKKKDDFQDIIVFLQNLPTSKWTNDDIELILAEAYQLKFMFADAPGHLNPVRT